MEQNLVALLAALVTVFGSVSLSVGGTFWIMRTMISDLRSQNRNQQDQITANLLAAAGSIARIGDLERRASTCESEHKILHEKISVMAENCPVTNLTCPLRVLFKR